MHHLDRMGAEPGLALPGPAVGRVGQVQAQHPDRFLVAAHRGAAQPADRAQVPEPLIEHGRGPQPGERVGVGGERAGGALPSGDRRPAQGCGPAAGCASPPASPRTPAPRAAAAGSRPPGAARPHPAPAARSPPSITSVPARVGWENVASDARSSTSQQVNQPQKRLVTHQRRPPVCHDRLCHRRTAADQQRDLPAGACCAADCIEFASDRIRAARSKICGK